MFIFELPKRIKKGAGLTPSPEFGLFFMPPRLSWRERAGETARMFSPPRWKQARLSKFGAGFTMIEVVIMLSIITVISTIVLFSFSGLNEGGALTRSVRELALALRKIQNMALAVNQIQIGLPPGPSVNLIPPAVGIKLIQGTSNYQIFADFSPQDGIYSGANEGIDNAQTLERRIFISSLNYYDAFGPKPISVVHVIFAQPEATMTITDVSGADLGDKLEINLTTPTTAACKKLLIRTSGQISIKRCP